MPASRVTSWLGVEDPSVAGSILLTKGLEGLSLVAPSTTCCQANGGPGCDDPTIEACVCAMDAFCWQHRSGTSSARIRSTRSAARVCEDLTEGNRGPGAEGLGRSISFSRGFR